MSKTTYQPVTVTDANGVTYTFQAGDEVPDDLAERIDNDAVWVKPEGADDSPLGWSDDAETGSAAPADAPYATDEGIAPFQPDSGPVEETGSTVLTGEPAPVEEAGATASAETGGVSSEGDVTATSKPSSAELDQMTRSQLDQVATNLGCDPSGASSKAEVRSLIDSVDVPVEPDL